MLSSNGIELPDDFEVPIPTPNPTEHYRSSYASADVVGGCLVPHSPTFIELGFHFIFGEVREVLHERRESCVRALDLHPSGRKREVPNLVITLLSLQYSCDSPISPVAYCLSILLFLLFSWLFLSDFCSWCLSEF